MEGQQDAVAEGADKLEVLHLRFGAFPNPTNLAILAVVTYYRKQFGCGVGMTSHNAVCGQLPVWRNSASALYGALTCRTEDTVH